MTPIDGLLPQPPTADPTAEPTTEDVPVVWPTGTPHANLTERGYLPATARDHHHVRPQIAAFAITAYTRPGAVVLDPDCGAGTVLVEAVRAGRRAVGLTNSHRWWSIARANLNAAQRDPAPTDHRTPFDGTVLDQPNLLTAVSDRVDLILTTWRHPPPTSRPDTQLGDLLTTCRPLLAPNGHLVVVARPIRRHGYLVDGPGKITAAARSAGLIPHARCIALTAPLTNGRLHATTSIAQRRALARLRNATGHPIATTAHHDVLVFRAPQAAAHVAVFSVCVPRLSVLERTPGINASLMGRAREAA